MHIYSVHTYILKKSVQGTFHGDSCGNASSFVTLVVLQIVAHVGENERLIGADETDDRLRQRSF